MGYYTTYELSWDDESFELPLDFQEETGLYKEDNYSKYNTWLNSKDNMLALSEIYPDVLFTLDGYGDEYGDIWKEYYKDGKYYHSHARIVYDDYDETKLV